MSAHNLPADLKYARFPSTWTAFRSAEGIALAGGTTVPTDASTGYAPGCIFIHTDGGEGTAAYINEGSITSCDFNAVAALTAAQEALLGAVAGTVTASKAVIVDANKDIATFRHVTLSGNLVSGSTTLSETDLAKVDGITNGTQAAGKAVVADANVNTGVSKVTALHIGATGSEVQVNATPAELNAVADASAQDVAPGTGADGAEAIEHACTKIGNMFYTQIVVDLTGLNSGESAGDIIGEADTANSHIGQLAAAKHGATIVAMRLTCLETPATGDDDIDLYSADEDTGTEDTGIGALTNGTQLIDCGNLTAGTVVGMTAPPNAMTQYLYLVAQTGDANATYSAGKLLIEMWGV